MVAKLPVVMQPEVSEPMTSRRHSCVITAAIVFLCFAFVVLTTMGVWYIKVDNECDVTKTNDEPKVDHELIIKENYVIGIPRYDNYNISMIKNHVQVDRDRKREYIVMKDPMKKHTMFIVYIDRIEEKTYIYGSEHGNCMIFPDAFYNFEQSLEYIRMYDGKNTTKPEERHIYKPTSTQIDLRELPAIMQVLCDDSELVLMKHATAEEFRVEEVHEVCVCFHYCWCSYCEDINCWGQCVPTVDPCLFSPFDPRCIIRLEPSRPEI